MKNFIITFLVFIISLAANAQYKVDWANAPLNQIPKQYTKNHFNILGEVESQASRGLKVTFNRKGLVTNFSSGSTFNYDSNNLLITQLSNYGTNNYSNDKQGRTVEYFDKYGKGSEFRYNDRGLWSEELNRETKELILRFSYDQNNRVIKREYFSQGKIAITTLYSYIKNGNELEVTKRIQQRTDPEKIEIEKYNDRGDCIFRDGKLIKYTYDHQRNIISMLESIFPITTTYTYFDAVANTPNAKTAQKTDCISGDCENGYGSKKMGDFTYVGYFENGKPDGPGTLSKKNYLLISTWKSGINTGYGIYTDRGLGNLAQGYFENLLLNGRAFRRLNEKFQYGKFSAGNIVLPEYKVMRTGLTSGCTFGDCEQQYGKYEFKNGSDYTGFFKNGNPEIGVFSDINKNTYNGEYVNGISDGFGHQMYANGDAYTGYFKNGMRNGKGSYLLLGTSPKLITAVWENDKVIKAITYASVASNLLQPTPAGPGLLSNEAAKTAIKTVKSGDLGFGNAVPDLNNVDNSAGIKKLYPGYNGSDKKFIANKISTEAAKQGSEDASIKYISEKIEEVYLLNKIVAFDTFIYIRPSTLAVKSQKLLSAEIKKFFSAESKRIKEEYLKKNPQR